MAWKKFAAIIWNPITGIIKNQEPIAIVPKAKRSASRLNIDTKALGNKRVIKKPNTTITVAAIIPSFTASLTRSNFLAPKLKLIIG